MPAIPWTEVTRAELFVRSDLPTPATRCRQTIVSHLEALVASGVIETYTVTSWAKRVPLDGDSAIGRMERDHFQQFEAWARSAGVSLEPGFDTRECYSSTTGEKQTQRVMPAACLVVYGDNELLGVVPHATPSGTVRIDDAIDRLADRAGMEVPSSSLLAD